MNRPAQKFGEFGDGGLVDQAGTEQDSVSLAIATSRAEFDGSISPADVSRQLTTIASGIAMPGIMAGLAARGAAPMVATAWAVYLHGEARRRWVGRNGQFGLLAREIPDGIPRLMYRYRSGRIWKNVEPKRALEVSQGKWQRRYRIERLQAVLIKLKPAVFA